MPFKEMYNICDVLIHAYDEGLKMGLDNDYKPQESVYYKKDSNKSITNPNFSPELYTIGLAIGAIYIQRGINHFDEWDSKMKESIGEKIKPWTSSIWETLCNYPRGVKFDEKQVMAVSRAVGARYESGITDYEEIINHMIEVFGEDNIKKIEPIVRVAYIGVRVFFEENRKDNKSMESNSNELKLSLEGLKQTKLF